ncbi:hypothetical protein [Halobacteriovorax sp. HLS]|uniref:hypothetical protein n=1 Tax=Halobacteriovorax sp. HLS TaxID=2234000 RepID=UPI000FD7507E|nr:hypothetical protein [Halobacteriovorax sp. HLS]
MKKSILLALLLSLVSCQDFDGTFKAKKDLVFKTKKSIFSSKLVKVSVPTNEYKTSIKFTSADKLKIDFEGIDKKIKIKLPENLNINRYNDEFFIAGSDINQEYDFDGKIVTTSEDSDTYRERESCSYTVYETTCRRECRTNDRGRTVCRNICTDYPVTRYGRRNVEYFYRYTTTDMRMKVLEQTTPVGLFKSIENSRNRIETYTSICR